MGLIGIDRDETYEYVSPFDKNEPKTVFVLRVLSGRTRLKLVPKTAEGVSTPEVILAAIKEGVKEVRNFFRSKDGKPETITEITDDFLDAWPLEFLMDVANEIMTKNFVTETERKN